MVKTSKTIVFASALFVIGFLTAILTAYTFPSVFLQTSARNKTVHLDDSLTSSDAFGPKLKVNVYVYKNGELVAAAHNIITNAGMGVLRDAVHQSTAGTAQYIALSTDGTAPAYTDTTCPSEITTGGLARAQGTVTTQAGPANGDITVRVEKTFTATSSFTGVQKACLFTASTGGTLYAVATFASTNLAANDQLTIRWDFSYNN
ncbi:MAG: hypothetical protein QXQ70_03210 [Candidatus Caldarchaeum sp.]